VAKDTYYLKHDSNAAHDPKMVAMLMRYKMEGYGRFWRLVEILREQMDGRIPRRKWGLVTLSQVWGCSEQEADEYIEALVSTYELIKSDGEFIWSNRVARDMEILNARRRSRADAGEKGATAKWGVRPNEDGAEKRSERLAVAREKGRHTDEEWQEMLSFFSHCVQCGSTEKIVKDHIIPIYQGGSDAIANLQPLCAHCNSSKGPGVFDHRPGFCHKNALQMPGKWLEMPGKWLEMPGKWLEMPGKCLPIRAEQSRAEETRLEQSSSSPPPASFPTLLKTRLEAAGVTLTAADLDACASKLIATSADSEAFLDFAIRKCAKAQQKNAWFVKGCLEWDWIAKWRSNGDMSKEKQETRKQPAPPSLDELKAGREGATPEEEHAAAVKAAEFKRSHGMVMLPGDRKLLGIPEPVPKDLDDFEDDLLPAFPEAVDAH